MTTTISSCNASNARKSTVIDVEGALDFDLTIKLGDGRTLAGAITLCPSEYDGRLDSYGTSIDMWISGALANDLREECGRATGAEVGEPAYRAWLHDACGEIVDAGREAA